MNSTQQTDGDKQSSLQTFSASIYSIKKLVESFSDLRTFLLTTVVAGLYFGAASLGLSLAYIHANVSPVWPPTGVAIAAVVLLGYRIWPGILLGAFFANLLTPVSVATAGGIAIGNAMEALSAGYLLRSLDFHSSFEQAKDVLKFVVAAVLCTTLSATIGNLSLCLSHAASWENFGNLWLTWWLGDTIGALLIAPLLLTWGSGSRHWLPRKRYLEASLLLVLLAGAAMATFGGPSPIPLRYYPIAHLTVPLFLWAAFRLAQRGVTLAILVTSVFAVWGTARGLGPFMGRTPNESLLLLQLFLGFNAVTFLFLVAAVEERRHSEETLRESEGRLAANLAITRILAESPAVSIAMPRILQTISDKLVWQVGDMWTPNANSGELQCLTVWREPTANVDRFVAVSRELTFAPGVGLPGRVWASLEAEWIPDVTKDPNFPRAQVAVAEGLHSAFAFPILSGKNFLGVMGFYSDEIRERDDSLLQMFSGIGSQIGQFIERRRAEEERERLLEREHAALAEAELANRTKDEFLATVSHELRTPLTAIVGWADILQAGKLDSNEADEAIAVINRNAKAQARLINDILDVARVVSGKLRLDLRPVHLPQLIQAAVDSLRPSADAKRIRLNVSLESNAGRVSGDPSRLEQIIWNLLSNAVKFTDIGGEIDVRLQGTASHIEIVVSDNGKGISAEFLPHVFDRFRQADGSTTRQGGLGLGLAIGRHLVELHGGTIEALSAGEGKGATFKVTFPCVGLDTETSPGKYSDLPK